MPAHPPRTIGNGEFVTLMASVQALQALGVDSMLPALGLIGHALHIAQPNDRQLIIGIFLLASGLGSLVPGALADRYGRKPVLYVCLVMYALMTTLCAVATSFTMILVGRALMGLACAGFIVLPAAIIRDRFEGDRMARTQSLVSMVFMVVPMIAPTIGQAVLLAASWRWIFGVMGTLALVVLVWAWARLPETLRDEHRQSVNLRRIASTGVMVLTQRGSVGYAFAIALVTGGLLGYINSSQQLVAEHFGAGDRFPLIFAGMALTMAVTAFINSRIVMALGARRVSHGALMVYISTSLLQFMLAGPGETLWEFLPLMTVNLCLSGFLGSNFASIALQPFARNAGAAASVQVFVRMVGGAGLGMLIGRAFDGTARPLACALVLAGTGSLALILFSEKGRLFRRLSPPGTVHQVL